MVNFFLVCNTKLLLCHFSEFRNVSKLFGNEFWIGENSLIFRSHWEVFDSKDFLLPNRDFLFQPYIFWGLLLWEKSKYSIKSSTWSSKYLHILHLWKIMNAIFLKIFMFLSQNVKLVREMTLAFYNPNPKISEIHHIKILVLRPYYQR